MKNIIITLIVCFITKVSFSQCINKISSGERHSIVLVSNGTINTWGYGALGWGFLGFGNNLNVLSPTQVGASAEWDLIFAGSYNTFAIKTDGTLWGTGANNFGQLGISSTINTSTFAQIGNANNWKMISSNREHTLGVKTDGTLWAWGSNNQGKLGDGTFTNKLNPTQIGTDNNWETVSTGLHQSFGLKSDGTIWGWGLDATGTLGMGNSGVQNTPTQIGVESNWTAITSGCASVHTLALKSTGELFVFGSEWASGEGCLGLGPDVQTVLYATQIGSDTDWQSISVCWNQSFGIKSNGTLWAWGQNDKGQLGDGTLIDKNIPTQIGSDTNWTAVSAGQFHTIALKNTGELFSWGDNANAQLGNGNYISTNTPGSIGNCTLSTEQFDNRISYIFPNPADDKVSIFLLNSVDAKVIEIHDLAGKLVIKTEIALSDNKGLFSISKLLTGFYNLTVKDGKGEILMAKKIIKN